MLKNAFTDLFSNYSKDKNLADRCWKEVESQHSQPGRHYHTLTHLENLYVQLTEVRPNITSWDVVMITLFYHDIVYNASSSKNEEMSAEICVERMTELGVNNAIIESSYRMILATKSHETSLDNDINYFTDADLSILGSSWEKYQLYAQNVRKEYSMYPNFMYKRGRRKVLKHFLEMERIFKTEFFFNKLELTARENLRKELQE